MNFASYLISMFQNSTRKIGGTTSRSRVLRHLSSSDLIPGSRYNEEHWAQYTTMCHPCIIDYDYIVKFETMREDAAYVLSKLGPHRGCLEDKFPHMFNSSETTSSVFGKYFSSLTPQQADSLKEAYTVDYKLFGYEK